MAADSESVSALSVANSEVFCVCDADERDAVRRNHDVRLAESSKGARTRLAPEYARAREESKRRLSRGWALFSARDALGARQRDQSPARAALLDDANSACFWGGGGSGRRCFWTVRTPLSARTRESMALLVVRRRARLLLSPDLGDDLLPTRELVFRF